MQFDIMVGNPPYQEMTGGGGGIEKAKSVYPDFIQAFINIGPSKLVMVIPARWYTDDSSKSINLRHSLFRHLRELVDFPDSKDCFREVLISGGICYFLWDSNYVGESEIHRIWGYKHTRLKKDLTSCNAYPRYEMLEAIVNKVRSKTDLFVSDICFDSNPFGFETYRRGKESKDAENNVMLLTSSGVSYIRLDDVTKNTNNIYRYKVATGYKTPGTDATTTKCVRKVINVPQILIPGVVCTQTYFVVGAFDEPEEAENFKTYLQTRFARAMMLNDIVGTTITRKTFRSVPYLDFTHSWTDRELNKKFNLTVDEILFIEDIIREM